MPVPAAPSVTNGGTAGTTTYNYEITAVNAAGETVASGVGTTATGNATLSATNYNILNWTNVANATSYNIYRDVAGTYEYIGNIATAPFNDIGQAATAKVAPTTSTLLANIGSQNGYPRYHGHSISNLGASVNTIIIEDSLGNQVFPISLTAGTSNAFSVMDGIICVNGIKLSVSGNSAMEGSIWIA